jgi:hypothetical protein
MPEPPFNAVKHLAGRVASVPRRGIQNDNAAPNNNDDYNNHRECAYCKQSKWISAPGWYVEDVPIKVMLTSEEPKRIPLNECANARVVMPETDVV